MTTSTPADPPDTARRHDLVAIAASAGGVEALKALVRELPADLDAAVLVALHLPRDARSLLAQILARAAVLPVVVAEHDAPLRPGRVHVGPPDSHLLVRDGRVLLGQGPRENGHRPSHDAMLRSIALEAGPRAIGVVLTGLLDDGAAGLAAVHRYGGTCLVQDPDDCEFPSMPRAALLAVPDARCLPLAALAKEIARAVEEPAMEIGPPVDEEQHELDVVELGSAINGTPVMPDGPHAGLSLDLLLPRLPRGAERRAGRRRHPLPLPHRARLDRGEPGLPAGGAGGGGALGGAAGARGAGRPEPPAGR